MKYEKRAGEGSEFVWMADVNDKKITVRSLCQKDSSPPKKRSFHELKAFGGLAPHRQEHERR
jgi:hypothetical protein